VHDYALVTFLDGGVSTHKERSTWHQEAMRRDCELLVDRQRRQGGRDDDDGSSSSASDSINSDGDDGGGDGVSASRKRGRKQDKGDKMCY
jgi:hypothetical protein